MSSANLRQVGGDHYQGNVQHWDIVWAYRVPYFPAQITRYASRHRKKNGRQDVEKALHYLDKYAELLSSAEGPVKPPRVIGLLTEPALLQLFCEEQKLAGSEFAVMWRLIPQHTAEDLPHVRFCLRSLLADYDNSGADPGRAYVSQG